MKILALTLTILTTSIQAEDMQAYLTQTQEMVRSGEHEEALERFVWFHNNALEHDPAMHGVRLSFALAYWKDLGDKFPPAMTALIDTRDRTKASIIEGEATDLDFHDVAALNDTLGDHMDTIRLLDILDQKSPAIARQYWNAAKDTVIKAQQYELAAKYIQDPMVEFREAHDHYAQIVAFHDSRNIQDPELKEYIENSFVEKSLGLIAVSLVLDDMNSAQEIRRKALAEVNDARLLNAILEPGREPHDESD